MVAVGEKNLLRWIFKNLPELDAVGAVRAFPLDLVLLLSYWRAPTWADCVHINLENSLVEYQSIITVYIIYDSGQSLTSI